MTGDGAMNAATGATMTRAAASTAGAAGTTTSHAGRQPGFRLGQLKAARCISGIGAA